MSAKKASADNPCEMSFGTAYYPDHWPESHWGKDLDRICQAGLKSVRFGEFSWSWYEPKPGQFDFKPFDQFVKSVEERDLRLVLCTPTATPPPWFDRLFPDGRLQNVQGQKCLSPRHFWCWNHAASRVQAEKTIRKLASHFRGCEALWGWQIDNEPNYAEEVNIDRRSLVYDFNPAGTAAFLQWLKVRYGSLGALNAAWWSNFWSQRASSWEDVIPLRVLANPHAWLDFMRWREANIAEFVHWQATLLRGINPNVKIGCNIPETGVKASVSIGQDYWAQARDLDWVGTDLYQATGNRPRDLEKLAYSTDLMRSAATAAGAQFILSETQAGPHERSWPCSFAGEGFEPDYLEQAADIYAARGAEQIWWFLWRPTQGGMEIGMNGLQNLDGSDSPRTAAALKLASHAPRLQSARHAWLDRKKAFIHYSRDSLLHASYWPEQLPKLEETFSGWHGLLEMAGFQVEFLDDLTLSKIVMTDDAILVLPHTSLASDSMVERLAATSAYIYAGPHTALFNEHGHLRDQRLPRALREKWQVDSGLWRDTGKQPTAPGLPTIRGFRELRPLPAARVKHRLGNHLPWSVSTDRSTMLGIDLGELYSTATARQRKAILSKLAF